REPAREAAGGPDRLPGLLRRSGHAVEHDRLALAAALRRGDEPREEGRPAAVEALVPLVPLGPVAEARVDEGEARAAALGREPDLDLRARPLGRPLPFEDEPPLGLEREDAVL